MSQKITSYKKEKILTRISETSENLIPILIKHYKPIEIEKILKEIMNELEKLLPDVPYIGTNENPFLCDFFDSLLFLALYKTMSDIENPARHVGQLWYEMREYLNKPSKFARFITQKVIFTKFIKKRNKKIFERMNAQNLPDNWNMELIEGDGKEFEWGINIRTCTIHKFYESHGGSELAPYICMADYALYYPFKKIKFKRPKLWQEAGIVVISGFKGGPTPREWPPEDREDFTYTN